MSKEPIFQALLPGTNKFERDALGATFVLNSEEKAGMFVEKEKGVEEGVKWVGRRESGRPGDAPKPEGGVSDCGL